MVYSYTPTYYSSLHDSITSICKSILPFSFKKKRLPAAEHKLAKLQSDNLKWQQDSFHQILNLMGLHREGILAEHEVSAYRAHLLESLIASPPEMEHPAVLRDKLLFLQELFYAKCISQDEYHASKRPLLQRLAVQGAEIEARDVIVGGTNTLKENSEEEWSDIDLKDEECLIKKESSNSKHKSKHNSALKHIKGASSVLSHISPYKPGKNKEEKSIFESVAENLRSGHQNANSSGFVTNEMGRSMENPFWNTHLKEKENETKTILMSETLPVEPVKGIGSTERAKRKPFRTLFHKEKREGHGGSGAGTNENSESEGRVLKPSKKQWGFEGFKKWKRNDLEDETAPLPLNERSDSEGHVPPSQLVSSPVGEGPDTKQIKRKLNSDGSSSDFFIDKVLGDKIKKELSRIQTELCTTNPSVQLSDEQIEAISTKLPVDKAELRKFFPKTWCDRYGDVVLDVVRKEFKEHVGEMENLRNAAKENHSRRWTTFEDDENCHPNLFSTQDHSFRPKPQSFSQSNPFLNAEANGNKQSSAFLHDQNPFWNAKHCPSIQD